MKRIVFPIGQDLFRAVTEGKWKLPKRVLLCLTPQIMTRDGNIVFNCEWDNVVNSAGGIMVQEIKPGFETPNVRTLVIINKSRQRSLKVSENERDKGQAIVLTFILFQKLFLFI